MMLFRRCNLNHLRFVGRYLNSTSATEKSRVWMRNEDGLEIVTLTEDRLDETLQIIRKYYFDEETVAQTLNLKKYPEAINELLTNFIELYNDGNSIIAIKQDKVVGFIFSQIQHRQSLQERKNYIEKIDRTCRSEHAREYLRFSSKIYALKNIFEHYNVATSLEMLDGLVVPTFRGSGVLAKLIVASETMARARGYPLISMILTSSVSRSVCKKLRYEELLEVPMSQLEFNGQPNVFQAATDQKIIIAAKLLSNPSLNLK